MWSQPRKHLAAYTGNQPVSAARKASNRSMRLGRAAASFTGTREYRRHVPMHPHKITTSEVHSDPLGGTLNRSHGALAQHAGPKDAAVVPRPGGSLQDRTSTRVLFPKRTMFHAETSCRTIIFGVYPGESGSRLVALRNPPGSVKERER